MTTQVPTPRRSFLLKLTAAGAATVPFAPDLDAQTQTSPSGPELDSQRFRRAAVSGDLPTVTRLLDQDRGLLYARDSQGTSVFTLAALAGQKAVTAELLRRGLVLDIFEAVTAGERARAAEIVKENPNVARSRAVDGRTPLHFACAAGRAGMIQYLSPLGADLSAGPGCPLVDLLRKTPEPNVLDGAQILLGNGANPNGAGVDGVTALQLAVERRLKPAVELLLRKGATPTAEATALVGQVRRDYYGGRLTKPLPQTDLPQEWINAFAVAAHTDLDQVKKLSKLCPELALTRATFDEIAIEAGAHMGRPDIVYHLAALGAPVSTCTAAMLGSAKMVRELLAADPQRLHERGAHDFPLLWYTAFGKQLLDVAEALLAAGADVNVNILGSSTLHVCAEQGHIELAQILLSKGLDLRMRTSRGVTALDTARAAKQETFAAFLVSRGA